MHASSPKLLLPLFCPPASLAFVAGDGGGGEQVKSGYGAAQSCGKEQGACGVAGKSEQQTPEGAKSRRRVKNKVAIRSYTGVSPLGVVGGAAKH